MTLDNVFILIAFAILVWGLSRLPKCDEPYDKWNYNFEYDEEGKPVMTKKYYDTKDV